MQTARVSCLLGVAVAVAAKHCRHRREKRTRTNRQRRMARERPTQGIIPSPLVFYFEFGRPPQGPQNVAIAGPLGSLSSLTKRRNPRTFTDTVAFGQGSRGQGATLSAVPSHR